MNVVPAMIRRGSETSLPTNLWSQRASVSVDSEATEDDEADNEGRRGSLANSSASPSRRGSSLFDFIEGKKKKNERKRYKDKQGFVWRRMVHEETEELPSPRAPHLGQWATPWLSPAEAGCGNTTASSTPLPSLASVSTTDQTLRKISMLSNSSDPPLCTQPPAPGSYPGSNPGSTPGSNPGSTPGSNVQPLDSDSLTSFKTCPSDSNLSSLIAPRINTESFRSQVQAVPLPLPVKATPPNATGHAQPRRPLTPPLRSTPPVPSYPHTPGTPAPKQTTPLPQVVSNPHLHNAINTSRPVQQTSENDIGGVRHLVRDM